MASKHLASILPQKGGPLVVAERTTPEPGPGEILIEVKAVALNPIDYHQRDLGMPGVPFYPAVIGLDAAGVVAKAEPGVSGGPSPGTRVAVMAIAFYENGSPDQAAFQKFLIAKQECVVRLPDHISFEQGALVPVAAVTALTAWITVGVPLDAKPYTPEDKQAVLVWGGASSIGTFIIQSARKYGFIVYTTASAHNHAYLKTLGVHAVFDYKSDDVVSQIVAAVKRDGVVLNKAHVAVGDGLQATLDVLKETRGDASVAASVAHSPLLAPNHPTLENTEIKFVAPLFDVAHRRNVMRATFDGWLDAGLKSGSVVPSPRVQLEEGGLDGLNAALDKLRAGVSCAKIVLLI
ncbi:chaperonin 10-like protein [Podospora didyma]|uniref:Chaperonin 10-like protein n=1 Tax=Podospora didyma TaxID=330526 RepID=A0AAE0NHT4_9PEZI|nr:chaperonin 10-like protein [Podospora didyma]